MNNAIYAEGATVERLDDIPLLVALQQRIGLAQLIDQVIERHWLHQGLSLGQLVVGWNSYILSQGDHRKVAVRDWVADHRTVLEELLSEPIRDTENHNPAQLPIDEAVKLYRQATRVERHFHLFNDATVGIEPIYLRRDDQIKGLVRLLSLCVRLLTLIEIVARRNLTQRGEKLSGLYEGNPKQQTDQPTANRLLRTFRQINRVQLNVAGQTICYLTPLSPLQRQILSILELDDILYEVPSLNSG
jgi:transposase